MENKGKILLNTSVMTLWWYWLVLGTKVKWPNLNKRDKQPHQSIFSLLLLKTKNVFMSLPLNNPSSTQKVLTFEQYIWMNYIQHNIYIYIYRLIIFSTHTFYEIFLFIRHKWINYVYLLMLGLFPLILENKRSKYV